MFKAMFTHNKLAAGLTFIELLVVLVITSVLALASVPVYQGYRQQVQQQLVQAELLALTNRFEANYSSQSGYQTIKSYSFPAKDSLYEISVKLTDNNTDYELVATPINSQLGAGALFVNSLGVRRHYQADSAEGEHKSW